jgi:hypothetical protein
VRSSLNLGPTGNAVLGAFIAIAGLGCTPRAQQVILDVPANHPVSVAPIELEPGASKVTAIDVPFGGGAYRYKEKDLAVLQQMFEETNPIPGAQGEAFRIHVLIRRILVAYHQSESAGISCVAWALTNPGGELIFDETFYAAAYTPNQGVNGVKKRLNKGITKRAHSVAQEVASGRSPPRPNTWIYEDYESAAAAIPDALGPILFINLQRGGVERGVEYTGETGEEFARCDDSIDWHYRLGIPKPVEEAASTEPSEEPELSSPTPPGETDSQ